MTSLTDLNWAAQVAVAPSGDFVIAWQTGFGLQRGKTSRVWIRLFRADGLRHLCFQELLNHRAHHRAQKIALLL